ncbi:ABC transporter permease [Exiguobacterium sp. KRL4]|uniref:ABC transporter permease subunit n=1 Tax=Exiguobacterium sp. KRL4 TaxID=1914536 RepID=UPI0008F8A6E6|nr:ABC transporter permease subunit [Exiguobacterium sp. KRL4]OIN67624.1 ABC transporter permease [Exiguobacterium sp. KRL4]
MMTIIWSLLKHNGKPITAYAVGTSLYLLMLAALYPSMMKSGLLEAKLQALPPEVLKAFQYDKVTGFDNVLDLLGGNYYGLIFQIIASLFLLSLAARLLARPIDNGELILYLAAPITRHQYTASAMIVMMIASTCLVLFNTFVLLLADWFVSGVSIDGMTLVRFQVNALFVLYAIGGFTLFVATLFDDERRAFSIAGGVLVLSIVLTIGAGLSEKMDWMRYGSIFSLFNTQQLLEGTSDLFLHLSILAGISLFFNASAFWGFRKRSLSI